MTDCIWSDDQTGFPLLHAPVFNPKDSRDVLLEAALACFARHGYEATTIRLVASRARRNSSLISYYFSGKEGLYREVFRFLADRFAAMDPPPAGPAREGEGPQQLRTLLRQVLGEVHARLDGTDPLQADAVHLWLSELHAPRHEVLDILRQRMEPIAERFRLCLRTLRPDLDDAEVDFLGISLHSCCIGQALLASANRVVWTHADPALDLDAMADRLTDLVCLGLPGYQPHSA